MGIRGARSLLDSDPSRYGQAWRWNYGDDDVFYNDKNGINSECNGDEQQQQEEEPDEEHDVDMDGDDNNNNNHAAKSVSGNSSAVGNNLILLVDGMSLLYHVAMDIEETVHASPATVRTRVYEFVWKILQALKVEEDRSKQKGDVDDPNATTATSSEFHIFLDGIPPAEKITTQLTRLTHQAIDGDLLARLARGETDSENSVKVLHLFAEWAMLEALEDLKKSNPSIGQLLHIHRASRGEAEAYIDHWIRTYDKKQSKSTIEKTKQKQTKIIVLADDTDFLVYPSCPGFTTFKSLQMEQLPDGKVGLSGFQYVRQNFLNSFLPKEFADSGGDVMPVVAALAGCDYVLDEPVVSKEIRKIRDVIVKCDISGLRAKHRNGPSSAAVLTAILRYVTYHMEQTIKTTNADDNVSDNDQWLQSLLVAATQNEQAREVLYRAFQRYREIYSQTNSLLLPPTLPKHPHAMKENTPTTPDIRRLLENSILFCRPLIEYWKKTPKADLTHFKGGMVGQHVPVLQGDKYSAKATVDPNYPKGDPNASSQPYVVLPKKRLIEEATRNSSLDFYAVVISPPYSRQVATWIKQDSMWSMPHFAQARLRLYCLIVYYGKKLKEQKKQKQQKQESEQEPEQEPEQEQEQEQEGEKEKGKEQLEQQQQQHPQQAELNHSQVSSSSSSALSSSLSYIIPVEDHQLNLHSSWTSDNPVVKEYVRSGTGKSIKMVLKEIEIPDYKYLATGWKVEEELFSFTPPNQNDSTDFLPRNHGDNIIDRTALFCILGNPKQSRPALNAPIKEHGVLFLSSLMLPFNLALLLILMGTAPKSLENVDFPLVEEQACYNEINKVLPLMTISCYHSILILDTLQALFGGKAKNNDENGASGNGNNDNNDDDENMNKSEKTSSTTTEQQQQQQQPEPSFPSSSSFAKKRKNNYRKYYQFNKNMYNDRNKSKHHKYSNFLSKQLQLSHTFQHDIALWIWQVLRTSVDLEQLRSDESDDLIEMRFALEYLENAILELAQQVPSRLHPEMKRWYNEAKMIWLIWWEVFDVTYTDKPLHEKLQFETTINNQIMNLGIISSDD